MKGLPIVLFLAMLIAAVDLAETLSRTTTLRYRQQCLAEGGLILLLVQLAIVAFTSNWAA